MDDRFFTAYFPDEAIVCGRRLNVFSPYHLTLLRAIRSPLVCDSARVTAADLLAAVKVCRQQFGKPVGLRASIRDLWWKRRMNRNRALFLDHCERFSRFMATHSSAPRFWTVVHGAKNSRELTGPDILILVTSLMMKTNFTEAEAWNLSMGRAQWIAAQISELEGAERRFLDENDFVEEGESA